MGDTSNLVVGLAREYFRLARAQGLVEKFSIKETGEIELLVKGDSESQVTSAFEAASFLRGLIAGARIKQSP